jgi:hypothetical protein
LCAPTIALLTSVSIVVKSTSPRSAPKYSIGLPCKRLLRLELVFVQMVSAHLDGDAAAGESAESGALPDVAMGLFQGLANVILLDLRDGIAKASRR